MKKLSITIFIFVFTIFSIVAQTDEQLGLHSEGGPWNFYPAKEYNQELPNVLLIGNSVMNGFKNTVIPGLKGKTNVDYWLTPKHLKSEFLFEDLAKIVKYRKYDVIHFNIGLHGWPEGRIAENEYVPLLEKYVTTIKENSSNSTIIWGSITPVTETGKPELNKEINPTIAKRNGLAKEVMQKFSIPVNDLYALVENKLELSKGDRFHWKGEGYKLMGNQTIAFILNELGNFPTLSYYDVVWNSPSKNSMGSMPAGNGDIGINLWVEENGDLLFYLSKTDAWSENGRLLKIGKVRLSLSPNPFTSGNVFVQKLNLKDGVIEIKAGSDENTVSINTWIDAYHPVVELDVKSSSPVSVKVSAEPWRTKRRILNDKNELHSAYGLGGEGAGDVFVEVDEIIHDSNDNIIWLHRNERSVWKDNLKLQGLEKYSVHNNDPLLNRTFGGFIQSEELKKTTNEKLGSKEPIKQFSVSVFTITTQTDSREEWISRIKETAKKVSSLSKEERLQTHKDWWAAFWDRSYIHISTNKPDEKESVFNVSRNYALQRYINACSGRGNSPIKFNGSIFTVNTKNLDNRYGGFDADYRQWGGPFWWQNTRLPYWSMLEAGDFDLMQPLFKMYHDALPIRKLATKTYYNHEGAFYPETMNFWGTYADANYGRDRSELPLGMTQNLYIRYYWQSGLEVSLMMLDYYNFTKDKTFLNETLIPVVSEIICFFDQHWGRDKNGKILFDPAMALETYNKAVNPLPEIVGINKVCAELLKLPETEITNAQQKQWLRLISELPEIPTQTVDGQKRLSPAQEYSGKQNVENPELYAIFPYRTFGIGKDGLEMARQTFDNRLIKQTGGWQQNAIKAALLGLTDEAAKLTSTNFNSKTNGYRFPTMWGPNYDWTPDQCHGTVAMSALQRMLVQYDNDNIYLLPAWPKEWNVEFKLLAPNKTTIQGKVLNGAVVESNISSCNKSNIEINKAFKLKK